MSTLARDVGSIVSIAVDGGGKVIVVDAWGSSIRRVDPEDGSIYVFPPFIQYVMGVTVSPSGIIYISTSDGIIYHWNDHDLEWRLLTRTSGCIRALKSDPFHNLIIARDNCIERVNTNTGNVSPFAGFDEESGRKDGLLLEARFNRPTDVDMNDSSIYICEYNSHAIRSISLLRPWKRGKRNECFFSRK